MSSAILTGVTGDVELCLLPSVVWKYSSWETGQSILIPFTKKGVLHPSDDQRWLQSMG